ncbi:MAG: acetylornithine/succinylornithine family transaminase [Defluviitaleaceae bacterium]|nr:acetylornithine/succinylornithine family transaminase [Defluviitaleaceae bacterium]
MLLNVYKRFPVTFVKGDGNQLYDDEGKAYLDFASGIGVNAIGHAHPVWVEAVTEQAAKLAHVSNLYQTEPAELLAKKLVDISGLAGVFFANSGAESNEGMIKMARKYSQDKYGKGRHTIITLTQSFHGRTITTLAATGQDSLHQYFDPFTEGFVHVPANDITAINALDHASTCAVLLEPVQGEGGVLPLDEAYVRAVAKLCEENDWLLLFDEVQTGIGRTGKWFAFQHFDVKPDAVSFAKGIGGGLPLGGFIVSQKCQAVLGIGDHGTTFGGNPIACAGALAVLQVVEEALPTVASKSKQIVEAFEKINGLSHVRGIGLMMGATVNETVGPVREVVESLLEAGLVVLSAGTDTLRLLPPLTITEAELTAGLEIVQQVCEGRLAP